MTPLARHARSSRSTGRDRRPGGRRLSIAAVCPRPSPVAFRPSVADVSNVQGSLPFQDAQFGEEVLYASGVPAESGGDVVYPRRAEDADGRVAQRGHRFGAGALTNLARILAEGHVAHRMRPVLRRPIAPGPPQEVLGAGDRTRHARDERADFRRGLTAPRDDRLDLPDLSHTRPVQVFAQRRGRAERPTLATAVTLVQARRLVHLAPPDLALPRGKRPRRPTGRRRPRCPAR